MIIGVDVDDTVADLVGEWLELYNNEYSDNVAVNDITTWDIYNHVKCGKKIYDFLKVPNFYDNVVPIHGAAHGIRSLRNAGHRVIFITSCIFGGNVDGKWKWLVDNKFLDAGEHSLDFMAVSDKALIKVDLMIDDKTETVKNFGDRGVLFKRPWNAGLHTWESLVSKYGSYALYAEGK
jgi:5'(3')-deoxyribonucleotidase